MDGYPQNSREGFSVDTDAVKLFVTAYTGRLKITGAVQISQSGRSTDRRPSDLLRNFQDEYMTLSDVKIYSTGSDKVLEEQQFSLLNLKTVKLIHAVSVEE